MIRTSLSKAWTLTSPTQNGSIVDLPHDFSISAPRSPDAPGGGQNGCFVGGVGTYSKYITLPADADHYLLNVEGAYCQTDVTFNEDLIYQHHHGYTPFLVDLTDRARKGLSNHLVIKVNDMQPSTRWYSGAGLYRDVYLWTGGVVRIEPWDVFITTQTIKNGTAELRIVYTITSDIDEHITLCSDIIAPDGKVVKTLTTSADVTVGKTTVCATVLVEQAALWDTEHPQLYSLHTTVTRASGECTDTMDNVFGIRTITADATHGLRLNGKTIKLRGGCLHHTHGPLGAADFPAAVERQIKKLRSVGFNAIRSAHNPPSLTLLETCDRLGVILMDEAFDMWRMQKNENDYHLWFELCWDKDIERMVKHDRNHPCVISYSIGNEIVERDDHSDGAAWAARIAAEIRKYDNTKLVTSGVCGLWGKTDPSAPADYHAFNAERNPPNNDFFADATEAFCKPLDIVGYNYMHDRYASDHRRFPDRVIWGSETWALTFYDSWKGVTEHAHVLGDFCWTCYDNLGENGTGRSLWARDGVVPGISVQGYEWISCFQGDFDLAGYRRPQSYFREVIWSDDIVQPHIFTTHPEHYGEGFSGTEWHFYDVHESWTFDDAYLEKPVKVDTYTKADEVAWFINGRHVGNSRPEKAIATIDIPYEKGEISLILYKDGAEVGRASLCTTTEPTHITLSPETTTLVADNRDLCYIDIHAYDDSGRPIPEDTSALSCTVESGELMGIFSGDPQAREPIAGPTCHLFEGHAVLCLRAKTPGDIKVSVTYHGNVYTTTVHAV